MRGHPASASLCTNNEAVGGGGGQRLQGRVMFRCEVCVGVVVMVVVVVVVVALLGM